MARIARLPCLAQTIIYLLDQNVTAPIIIDFYDIRTIMYLERVR